MSSIINTTGEISNNLTINRPSGSNSIVFQLPTVLQFVAYSCCPMLAVAFFLYVAILWTFFHRRTLITPFSIHIIILNIVNLINTAIYNPLLLSRNMHRDFFRGNYALCCTLKYVQWTSVSLCILQHVVICIDRWVAVLWPMWYRTRTVKFGLIGTAIALFCQQALYLPIFIADAGYPIAKDQLCDMTQPYFEYQQVARISTVLLPHLFLCVSYPLLLYKIFSRKSIHAVQLAAAIRTGRIPADDIRVVTARRLHSEQRLALVLVVMQIVLWLPQTIGSIMFSARIPALPYQYDIFTFFGMFPVILLVTDPITNLVFMKSLRAEVFREVGELFKLAGRITHLRGHSSIDSWSGRFGRSVVGHFASG